jgi:hypothetical protein
MGTVRERPPVEADTIGLTPRLLRVPVESRVVLDEARGQFGNFRRWKPIPWD